MHISTARTFTSCIKSLGQEWALLDPDAKNTLDLSRFFVVQANGAHLILVKRYEKFTIAAEGQPGQMVEHFLEPVEKVLIEGIDMAKFTKPLSELRP